MSVKAPVNDNRDSNEFVRELFTSEIKEPFSHNIAFNDVNDVDKLFEKIKQIFMIGAMIHCGDLEKKVIFMDKMTPNIFECRGLEINLIFSKVVDGSIIFFDSKFPISTPFG